ncbi:MAG: sodium:alanine symporter family protein, partial [Treponema sp.]|nr:sodium:alanine symporter family protein [Treponema sp.]
MFNQVLDFLDNSTWGVWGIPTMVIILGTGLLLTICLRGLQFRRLGYALRTMFRKPDGEKGEVSSFGALCTALSATIGTGNIVGVATALVAGGPGALFWMWVAALLGMATKYAECLVAIHYREQKSDGHILGGAFYAIEKGMGKNWKWLAILFALFGTMVGLFGIGTFSQVNSISSAINTFFDSEGKNIAFTLFGINYTYATVISSLVVAIFVALIIIGGLKRISKVATYIVPFMAILYFIFGIIILVTNATAIPGALVKIFRGAFGLDQVAGGAFGFMLIAMQKGIARGIFSNEAGLGSAPIAASAAQVKDPVQQAVISMTGTFFDTIIICTITGLAIVIAGSYDIGLKGYAVTDAAFKALLPFGNTFT